MSSVSDEIFLINDDGTLVGMSKLLAAVQKGGNVAQLFGDEQALLDADPQDSTPSR